MDELESKTPSCCEPVVTTQAGSEDSRQPLAVPGASLGEKDAPWVDGAIYTAVGQVPRVATKLLPSDILSTWKVRWGIGRNRYRVQPGLYAVGNPDKDSHVLVTANYKMTFDHLRTKLGGRDVWILVLDTGGVNVWCSAGKGTFGAEEILRRIQALKLDQIVSHRTFILPQLSAPGVNAHEVKRGSGFRVVFGPVRAEDLPAFLDAGMKATREMRIVRFSLKDRVVLVPIEIVGGMKTAFIIALFFFFMSGLGRSGYSTSQVEAIGSLSVMLFLGAYLAGAVFTPVLLPWLPGRSFSAKGTWIGLVIALGVLALTWPGPGVYGSWLRAAAWFLIIPAITSFIAMNFTGASTYTSLSGVRKEMRIAVPVQLTSAISGLVLWMVALFV